MTHSEDDTARDFPAYTADERLCAEWFEEVDLEIGALTHRGRVRERNEDQYCVVRRVRSGVVLGSSLPVDELPQEEAFSWLLTVADGLGGQARGDVASATAIRTILDFGNRLGSWIMRPTDGLREDLAERADLYVQQVQEALQRQAEANPELVGMASTLTAAYIFGANATIINLGDSRSYLVRDGQIYQLTRDHTLAQELEDKGAPPEKAHPYRNVLTRCFNTAGERVHVDLFHVEWKQGDHILLCSDGLTNMVTDRVIADVVDSAPSTKEACESLVARALDNGGKDNITVVLARAPRRATQP